MEHEDGSIQKTYQFDVVIGYFAPETEDEAKALYDDLKEKYPSLNPYCFAKRQGVSFKNTDVVTEYKAKAYVLLVSDKMVDAEGMIPFSRLYKEKGDALEPGGVMKELIGATQNDFIREVYDRLSDGLSDTVAIQVLRVPSKDAAHKVVSAVCLPKKATANLAFDPFDKTTLSVYDVEGKAHVDAIAEWVKDVRKVYHPKEINVDHLYWVGTRHSDVEECDDLVFDGSICLFGEHDPAHGCYAYCGNSGHPDRIDHNQLNEAADSWVFETVKAVLEKEPNAHFYCYNPIIALTTRDEEGKNPYLGKTKDGSTFLSHFVGLNDEKLLSDINNKKRFRDLIAFGDAGGNAIHFIPCVERGKKEIRYSLLRSALEKESGKPVGENARFVIQAPVASGGASTFILEQGAASHREILRMLDDDCIYICTVFQEKNIPVNVHCIVFDNGGEPRILLSAPSIQLLRESGGRLMYRGADYFEVNRIPHDLLEEFYAQAKEVCVRLYHNGFRGICGVDGIITNVSEPGRLKQPGYTPYEDVYVLEVNARFQASSGLLNRALLETPNRWPSLQKLNLYACSPIPASSLGNQIQELFEEDKSLPALAHNHGNRFSNLPVHYANFSYIRNNTTAQAMHLLSLKDEERVRKENYIVAYELDGLPGNLTSDDLFSSKTRYETDAYLYRIVFSTNLVFVNNESKLYFNENIIDETEDVYDSITQLYGDVDRRQRMIRLKVALLIQGVVFSKEATTTIRPGTFGAVDLVFADKGRENRFESFVVNAPIVNPANTDESKEGIKFTGLTPFVIKKDQQDLVLKYYDVYVDHIFLFPEDQITGKTTDGVPYSDLAYLSTDRLRVHLTNACKFKRRNAGCRFCGIKAGEQKNLLAADKTTFASKNVKTVVTEYVETYRHKWVENNGYQYYPALRHFLVGGQTMDLADDGAEERLIDTVHQISLATKGSCEIYAMIVPCSPRTVIKMKEVGLTHLAFNIEVFDNDFALRAMPGKRGKELGYSTEQYLNFLKVAREIMDEHESVRSMLMIGLEPLDNTVAGIKALLDIDVQPMLSIFRPMPETPFRDYMSPQIADVVALFEKADALCKEKTYVDALGNKHVMHLGPDCTPCQNNTVSLPYEEDE